ncbi:hypothetical protein D3C81_195260 [compost metagenome]
MTPLKSPRVFSDGAKMHGQKIKLTTLSQKILSVRRIVDNAYKVHARTKIGTTHE